MSFAFIRKLLSPSWKSRRPDEPSRLGARGEWLAARYLKRHGHRIQERNYRCAFGEIDLVTMDGSTRVFVEVKTRSDDRHADPEDAVGIRKQTRLIRAARHYLSSLGHGESPGRFDVVSIVWPAKGRPRIEHIPDAFRPVS